MNRNTLKLFAGALFVAGSAAHAAALPGPVVSAKWLHDHRNEVQVLDIRDDLNTLTADPRFRTVDGKKVVSAVGGYIPDALSANFWALREKRTIAGHAVDFLPPTAEEFQEVMRASVLEPGKPIVVAPTGDDATSLQEASFLVWELEVFGQPADQVAILDGGTHAWIAAGYEVDNDAIAPMNSGHWTAKPADPALIADVDQVEAAQSAHQPLFDARPMAQAIGTDHSPVLPHAGRLAGARPLPPALFYRHASDGSWHFLSAAELKDVLAYSGEPESPGKAIVFCNTGQYAAGAWFAYTRILGASGMREFPGGMNEWMQRGLPTKGL